MKVSDLCSLSLSFSLVIYGILTAHPDYPGPLIRSPTSYQTWLSGPVPTGQTGIVVLAVFGEDLVFYADLCSCRKVSVKHTEQTQSSPEMCQALMWRSKLHNDCLITLQW